MSRSIRFAVALVFGLAVLTAAASAIVHSTTRQWFERDIVLRSELVINGVRRNLAASLLNGDQFGLREQLADITHDERIMAAAACADDGSLIAKTDEFPSSSICRELHVESVQGEPWTTVQSTTGGDIHITALPLFIEGLPTSYIVLVHDMMFVERREGATRTFLLVAFAILGLAAAVVTLVAARLSWRSWNQSFAGSSLRLWAGQ